MKLPLFIASRYIRSNKKSYLVSLISFITITGIALGVAVLIIALTILDGFDNAVREKIVNFNSHIVITGFSGKNLPPLNQVESLFREKMNNDLLSVSELISKNAIIRSNENSDGIILIGIDPLQSNLGIDRYIIQGSYFKDTSNAGIIIGRKLAERLSVEVSEKITVFTLRKDQRPTISNPPNVKQFFVTGIYESGMAEYDDLKAYITLNDAKILFENYDRVSGYNLKLKNLDNLNTIEESLQEYLGYPFYVRSIYREHQNIFTWLELQKEPIPIILGMIILVAVFNIVGTILMVVIERTNAIGILKSLGCTTKQIIKIFLIHGIFISIVGIVLGNVIAVILSLLQLNFNIISLPGTVYFLTSVPITINALNYFMVSAIAFILCLSSSFVPSIIASKIRPIRAIRFN